MYSKGSMNAFVLQIWAAFLIRRRILASFYLVVVTNRLLPSSFFHLHINYCTEKIHSCFLLVELGIKPQRHFLFFFSLSLSTIILHRCFWVQPLTPVINLFIPGIETSPGNQWKLQLAGSAGVTRQRTKVSLSHNSNSTALQMPVGDHKLRGRITRKGGKKVFGIPPISYRTSPLWVCPSCAADPLISSKCSNYNCYNSIENIDRPVRTNHVKWRTEKANFLWSLVEFSL